MRLGVHVNLYHAERLGELGEELQEVFDSEKEEDEDAALQKVRAEIEPPPSADASTAKDQGDAIPVAPAATGELS